MSDLSPQIGPKRTLNRSLAYIGFSIPDLILGKRISQTDHMFVKPVFEPRPIFAVRGRSRASALSHARTITESAVCSRPRLAAKPQ